MSDIRLQTIEHEMLVKSYGGIVTNVAGKMIQDPNSTEDAVQEAWYEILKSLPSFNGRSKLSTWIYRISSRVILKFAKKERIYSKRFMNNFFDLDCSNPFVTTFYNLNEELGTDKQIWVKERCKKCLTAFLHCLSAEARMILVLREIASLSYEEISEICNKKVNSTRQIVSRSRRRVNNFLDGNCVLYSQNGKCRCHLREQVADIDLAGEYSRLRESVENINVFQAIDKLLPEKNYWEIML